MPLAEMFVSSILEFRDLSKDIPRSWAKKLSALARARLGARLGAGAAPSAARDRNRYIIPPDDAAAARIYLGAGARVRAWAPARAHALARLGAGTRAPGSNECNELESGALERAMMQNSTSKPSRALGRQPRRGSCRDLPRQSNVQ